MTQCGCDAYTSHEGGDEVIQVNRERGVGCAGLSLRRRGLILSYVFFFQAEDGIRDGRVTGVQTCALPISLAPGNAGVFRPFGVKLLCTVRLNTPFAARPPLYTWISSVCALTAAGHSRIRAKIGRARVGKECRSRRSPYQYKKNYMDSKIIE